MAQLVDACGARSGLGRTRQRVGPTGLAWLYVMYARTAEYSGLGWLAAANEGGDGAQQSE